MAFLKISTVQAQTLLNARKLPTQARKAAKSTVFSAVRSQFGIPKETKLKVFVESDQNPLYCVLRTKHGSVPLNDGKPDTVVVEQNMPVQVKKVPVVTAKKVAVKAAPMKAPAKKVSVKATVTKLVAAKASVKAVPAKKVPVKAVKAVPVKAKAPSLTKAAVAQAYTNGYKAGSQKKKNEASSSYNPKAYQKGFDAAKAEKVAKQ